MMTVNYDHKQLLHKKRGKEERKAVEYTQGLEPRALITTVHGHGGREREGGGRSGKEPQPFLSSVNYPHFLSLYKFSENQNPFFVLEGANVHL